MRLDKYVSLAGAISRKDATRAIKSGSVTVDGTVLKKPDAAVDENTAHVTLGGAPLLYERTVWVMLNKPAGYVSATEDGRYPVVTELLPPELVKRGLFPVGRLDKDTLGLMLLTDDGTLAHLLLSPKRHVEKRYRFTLTAPLPADAEERCLAGIPLSDFVAKPATLLPSPDRMGGEIVLTEGKYHEIKRMMHALGTEIETLERIRFARLALDSTLARGEWRRLTTDEIRGLEDSLPALTTPNKGDE